MKEPPFKILEMLNPAAVWKKEQNGCKTSAAKRFHCNLEGLFTTLIA
jgi:hypothetical protein